MPISKQKLLSAKQISGTGFLILLLMFVTAYGQPTATNFSPSTGFMKTNIVDKAMTMIRQHNFGEARELLLAAAEKGDVEPQALLGQMYNAGWGVPTNYELAFKWWSAAANGGSADAQWGLGLLYDDGKGVAQDSKKAAFFWKKAVEHGNIKATVNLAFLYEDGRGVERDLKECARLFKIAAEAGEPAAQLNYGLKLLHGEGIEQNKVLGCAWIGVAAESHRPMGSIFAEKIRNQKVKTWGDLSVKDREIAEKLKEEIQSHHKKS